MKGLVLSQTEVTYVVVKKPYLVMAVDADEAVTLALNNSPLLPTDIQIDVQTSDKTVMSYRLNEDGDLVRVE